MSKNTSTVNITILDKDYLITCEEEEIEVLRNSADYLNKKMLELKNNSSVIGSERIAIMTALNITNEFLAYKKENQDYTLKIDNTLKHLQSKLNDALVKDRQSDMVETENPLSQGR